MGVDILGISSRSRQGRVKSRPDHWCDDADGLHFKKCAVGTDFLKLTISKLLEFLDVNVGMDPIFLGKFLGNFLDNFFLRAFLGFFWDFLWNFKAPNFRNFLGNFLSGPAFFS